MRIACCASLCTSLLLFGCGFTDDKNASAGVTAAPANQASNAAPTISGSAPGAAYVGVAYSFRPQAVDADGDSLTFSIVNQPGWATFSPTTGELSGVPQLGDVGSYGAIELRVSDGRSTVSAQVFSIQVVPANQASGQGTATLSWAAPTLNEDGTPLVGLAGYRIYYGQDSARLDHVVQLADPGTTRYRIEALVPGTHYFGVAAYTTDGVESRISELASKTIS